MKNSQSGLIAVIVVLLIVIVGGAYYFSHGHSNTLQGSGTATSTSSQTQSITINQSSLVATGDTATITGTAIGIQNVKIEVRDPSKAGTIGDVIDSASTAVTNGKWSFTVNAPDPGNYYLVAVYSDEITNDTDYYDNKVKLTRASAPVSVSGMTKYTDASFGFSFWYPSNWKVVTLSTGTGFAPNVTGGTVVKTLGVGTATSTLIEIEEFHSTNLSITDTGGAGPFGAVTYYFDTKTHQWMVLDPGPSGTATNGGTPAIVPSDSMGGLHLFGGTSRFDTRIIPLSAENFVVMNDGGESSTQPLAKTVVALDPSVATPVSAAEQKSTIEAEQQSYK